jgi:hypothetical protein
MSCRMQRLEVMASMAMAAGASPTQPIIRPITGWTYCPTRSNTRPALAVSPLTLFSVSHTPSPQSIWTSSTTPAVDRHRTGIHVAGSITGLRFYKSAPNMGTRVANLWSSSGILLGSATFSNETASGWQEVNFSTLVTIAAAAPYVASYHTSVGHFSVNHSYLCMHCRTYEWPR